MNLAQFIKSFFYNKDKFKILSEQNINSFNYFQQDFLSSVEFIEFISIIEEKFNVTFEDHHLNAEKFHTVGGVIETVNSILVSVGQ